MKPIITVITCTHNPRINYLDKVLAALKSQTLPLDQWEYLLIDNASQKLLYSKIDLSWHPQGRHIREEQLGLTHARLRGIKEARGETLVFVDDDNILEADFLEKALQIAKDWSILGAWGGQIIPYFEEPPPEWTKPYWPLLAIQEFDRDRWSNLLHQYEIVPYGAGLCIRKIVAEKYAKLLYNQPERANMDRKGKLLISGGDIDLALTACDVGLGIGQFTSLKVTHLIPSFRLQEDYLLRLMEGINYSLIMLKYFRGQMPSKISWRKKLLQYYTSWQMSSKNRRFYNASIKGETLAIQEIYAINIGH
ncbi:MAG: glycosyltransferase [Nostoc sp.]|uniref:glycosyltransferase n=1 Tax=Nostoc sp. TaxID=1180 RepID=UPI002FF3AEDD